MKQGMRKELTEISDEFAECATLLSQHLEATEQILVSLPCFSFEHRDDTAILSLRKIGGCWRLAIDEGSRDRPVAISEATVAEKHVAANMLDAFVGAYYSEMKQRVRDMQSTLWPRGRVLTANVGDTT